MQKTNSLRGTRKEFLHFLYIANGSAAELETQTLIASDIYPRVDWQPAITELNIIQKMLTSFMSKMR